jgi:hypothetical protein
MFVAHDRKNTRMERDPVPVRRTMLKNKTYLASPRPRIYIHKVTSQWPSRRYSTILTDAIESAAHGHRLASDPQLLKVWIEKNDSEAAKKVFKQEFECNKAMQLFDGLPGLHKLWGSFRSSVRTQTASPGHSTSPPIVRDEFLTRTMAARIRSYFDDSRSYEIRDIEQRDESRLLVEAWVNKLAAVDEVRQHLEKGVKANPVARLESSTGICEIRSMTTVSLANEFMTDSVKPG